MRGCIPKYRLATYYWGYDQWAQKRNIHFFKKTIEEFPGAKFMENELKENTLSDTPEYILLDDKDHNEMAYPDLDEEVLPKAVN